MNIEPQNVEGRMLNGNIIGLGTSIFRILHSTFCGSKALLLSRLSMRIIEKVSNNLFFPDAGFPNYAADLCKTIRSILALRGGIHYAT